jgi:TolA-binding protein
MEERNIMRKWTVNWSLVLTAAMSAGGTAWAVNASYFELVGRVTAVESKNAEQDQHMTRIEQSQAKLESSTTQQLRDISSDLKEVRNYLLNNAAGQRPDIARWSRR